MSSLPKLAFSLIILASLAAAQSQGLPPLIDRELLFGNPEIAGAQISPDGQFLAFIRPWKDTLNVWVKKTGEPFASAHLLTAETRRPVAAFQWSRDGKSVLYVKDNAGDENFNLYAVDPAAAAPAGSDAPPSRDLTGLKGVQVQIYSVPKNQPDTVYIGINDRDKAWHDLYEVRISTGAKKLVRENTNRISGWFFDLKGQVRLAFHAAENGDQQILRFDPKQYTLLYTCSVFETCGLVRFHKDGKRVYLESNKGDRDLTALQLLDVETGKTEVVESDPEKRADLGAAAFSEVTDELVLTAYTSDRTRRYFHDKAFETDYRWLEAKFPRREIRLPSRSADERIWVVTALSDTEPGETYLFDRKTRAFTFQYRIRETLPRQALSPMEPVLYKSSDGLDIPAYLTLPKGAAPKALPALVIPHGGPWARDAWGFNPLVQFFANRGYAVLMPNFRGSSGFGKKFLNAGNGEWGRKMQDDITWGVKYLVARGIADPKRIGIAGASYGGYATLAGLAFTPDLYRAGVDIVGPSNLATLLDSIPPYWEAGRKMMHARMADPATAEGKAWLRERSPLNAATKIQAAVMVVQGANDPRVNRAEAEQIVIALRDRGFPVEYLLAPDEGHGFARPINNLAMFMAVEKFLAAQLGGRYQEGGSAAVTARLAVLTVDPKTVKLSKKVEPATVGVPKPVSDLRPGTYNYQAKIAAGGREVALRISKTIREADGAWTVIDTTETPAGPATDIAELEKGTLISRKRTVKQGAVTLDITFTGDTAKGVLVANGQTRQVSADLGGALFGDGPAAVDAIGALPLAEGYTVTYRNFDMQKLKAALLELKVTSSETVTVAAGKFDTWRVEISSADGGYNQLTVWISKDTHRPVKFSTTMTSAAMTAELLP
jgi:dipeptidyl aminopeptidase/acylaminoacyl peptidase